MDSYRQIDELIFTYAELMDAGNLATVAELFTHGVVHGVENGPPETVFEGAAGVKRMFEMLVRLYDDGTPKTKHLTTNVRTVVDEADQTARSTSYYAVTQATPELPLQVIVTGHYRDTFHRVDGAWWFKSRTMFVDQVGDTSQHLKW